MADKLITVATFNTPMEAALARNHLESEGIPAFLADEETIGILGGLVGAALGGVKLMVSEDHVLRAEDLLTSLWAQTDSELDEPDPMDPNITAEPDEADWVNKPVGEGITERGAAASRRAEPAVDEPSITAETPPAEKEPLTEPATDVGSGLLRPERDWDETLDQLKVSSGEELARRALHTALIGLVVCPGILHVYSIVLLLRLANFQGELSGAAHRKVVAALAIDMIMVTLIAIVLAAAFLH
jgi:hypothetical protein